MRISQRRSTVKKHGPFLCAVHALVVVCAPDVGFCQDPKAEDLIRLLPLVKTGPEGCRNLKISGRFNFVGEMQLDLLILYRAPDRFAVYATEPLHGTPVFYVNDTKYLIHGPADNRLFFFPEARLECILGVVNEKLHFNFSIEKDDEPSSISFDAKSFFAGSAPACVVKRREGSTYQMTYLTPGGNFTSAVVDSKSRVPLKRLTVTHGGEADPFLVIHEFAVDEADPSPWPSFPSRAELAATMRVDEPSDVGLMEDLAFQISFSRSVFGRLSMQNKEMRRSYDKCFLTRTDWAKVEADDRRNGPRVRALLDKHITMRLDPERSDHASTGKPAILDKLFSTAPQSKTRFFDFKD